MARPDSDLTLEALAARVAMLERQVSSGTLSATATAPVVTGTGTAKARPAAVAKARPVTAAAAVAATEAPAAAKAVETTARPTMEAVAEVSAVKTPSTEVAEATETTEVTAHPTAEATEVTRPSTEVAEATSAVERVSTASADERVVPVADVVTAVEQDQPSAADAATGEQETPDSQRGSLTSEAARHLWLQLEKELAKAKKRSLVTLLGGSSAHLDPKTGGLLIELPNNASFAKQNLERQDNTSLLASLIERLHGTALPFVFVLGREKAAPLQTEPSPAEPSPAEQPPAEQPAAEPPQTEPLPQTEPSPDESTQADSASAQAVENGKSEEEPSLEDIFSASFGTGVAIHEVKD
jgi:DNA polymerase-3 subunit gamma/tau